MKRILTLVFFALLTLGAAQIGSTPEDFVVTFDPLEPAEEGYTLGDFDVSLEERGSAVYGVSGEGVLDEAGIEALSGLIGAATGYGESIAEPTAEFFRTRIGELAGQGPVRLAVQEFDLALTVMGEAAPFDVRFELVPREVPAEVFPPTRHTLGPEDAKYVIREFSDFQCPFCARYATQTLPALKETLLSRGDVRFEYHHLPLQSIHANALPAAEAAECITAANTPEAFWLYHDALFERQGAWEGLGDPNPYFVRLAQDLGLETEGVETCLEKRHFADEIGEAYRTAAETLGLRSTPSVFVNGFPVTDFGNLASYERATELVDAFAE